MKDGLKVWIKDIAVAIVIALVIIFFFKPTLVKQSSMEPNFYENNYLFVSRQAYHLFGDPERGDVVVVHSSLVQETGAEKMLIKRIVGLPGETIEIIDHTVHINGEPLEEPYLKEDDATGDMEAVVVPDGEYFCMGDNRRVSIDSRDPDVGSIPRENIIGKVVLRIYPFREFGLIKNPLNE